MSNEVRYTLKEIKERFDNYAKSASDSMRQLTIAGIAVSWLFFYNDKTDKFDSVWLVPIGCFIVALIIDVTHNIIGSRKFEEIHHKVLSSAELDLSSPEKGYASNTDVSFLRDF